MGRLGESSSASTAHTVSEKQDRVLLREHCILWTILGFAGLSICSTCSIVTLCLSRPEGHDGS